MLIDNFSIFNSKRKSYLIIVFIAEIIMVLIIMFTTQYKINIYIIFICNFLLNFTFAVKEVILVALCFQLKSYYQYIEDDINYVYAEKSLGVHYASKYIGRMIAFIILFFLTNKSKLISVLTVSYCLIDQPLFRVLFQRP